jgi:hypothetical protein
MRKDTMKKLLLAALLALPLSLLGGQKASAQCCFGLKGAFNIKVCASGSLIPYCEKFPCCVPNCGPCGGCGSCGSCGGYGGGGCGGGYGCGCPGPIPGPWYAFWPYDGNSQIAPCMPGWSLDNHFQVAAPTGYPYWPNPMVMHASPYAYGGGYGGGYGPGCVQPVGYSPGSWYGR